MSSSQANGLCMAPVGVRLAYCSTTQTAREGGKGQLVNSGNLVPLGKGERHLKTNMYKSSPHIAIKASRWGLASVRQSEDVLQLTVWVFGDCTGFGSSA